VDGVPFVASHQHPSQPWQLPLKGVMVTPTELPLPLHALPGQLHSVFWSEVL